MKNKKNTKLIIAVIFLAVLMLILLALCSSLADSGESEPDSVVTSAVKDNAENKNSEKYSTTKPTEPIKTTADEFVRIAKNDASSIDESTVYEFTGEIGYIFEDKNQIAILCKDVMRDDVPNLAVAVYFAFTDQDSIDIINSICADESTHIATIQGSFEKYENDIYLENAKIIEIDLNNS